MKLPRAGPVMPVLVLILALGLRLWYVTTLPGQEKDVILSDMKTYDYTAWQMVRGLPVTGEPGLNGYHPLSASTYYFVGYTYFLAAIYRVAGHAPEAVRIVQAVVGTATVGLVYVAGCLAFGRRPATLGALLTAIYLPLVYYEGLLLTETWFIFLQMASLVLWMRAWAAGPGAEAWDDRQRPGPRLSLGLATAAGLTAGLACLTRAAFVLAVGTLAAGGWLVPPVPTPRGRRAVLASAFLLSAAAAIAPVTVRNFQIHGRFIPISTNGPSTFVTGHVTHSSGLPPGLPPGASDAEMAERHRRMALAYLARHWRTYLAEIPECFENIWTDNDFWPSTSTYWMQNTGGGGARLDVQAHLSGSPPFGRLTYFPDLVRYADRLVWCLVGLPMGFLAAWFLPAGHRRWSPFYLALVPYLAIPFIAYPFSRYRLPATPLVFPLAGQALWACWRCRVRRSPAATDTSPHS